MATEIPWLLSTGCRQGASQCMPFSGSWNAKHLWENKGPAVTPYGRQLIGTSFSQGLRFCGVQALLSPSH